MIIKLQQVPFLVSKQSVSVSTFQYTQSRCYFKLLFALHWAEGEIKHVGILDGLSIGDRNVVQTCFPSVLWIQFRLLSIQNLLNLLFRQALFWPHESHDIQFVKFNLGMSGYCDELSVVTRAGLEHVDAFEAMARLVYVN